MDFEILSDISDIETIAVGYRIRDIAKLREAWKGSLAKAERHRNDSSSQWTRPGR